MKSNLVNITIRHLNRHRTTNLLHVVGLTLGITVCTLIALFIRYELSFDSYHTKANTTYRVISDWYEQGNLSRHFSTPFPLANALRNEATGYEAVTFVHPVYVNTLEVTPQQRFLVENVVAAEPAFLDIFSIEELTGDLRQTLSKPYQAALTESSAKKFFGSENPIGKTFKLKMEEDFEFTVTSVIKDLPANTHLEISVLVSHSYQENFLKSHLEGWTWVSGTETFVTVPTVSDTSKILTQLKGLADKYINVEAGSLYRSEFSLQPMNEMHFATNMADGNAMEASWLWFFGAIGLVVLVLACINFMNLSTAQALTRAKEVGIRKSIGAGRSSLIFQFLVEAWTLTFISGVLAMALVQVSLPILNAMIGKGITFNILGSPVLLATLVVGLFTTGLLAGIYPAWVITKFSPGVTLKAGSMKSPAGGYWLRKGLVVAQFTVSACLLMAVILMSQQVNFLRNADLGFDKENVILVDVSDAKRTTGLLSNELAAVPTIKGVSFSTSTPSSDGHWGTPMSRISRNDPGRKPMTLILADNNFGSLYNVTLLAGRNIQASDTNFISKRIPSDQRFMNAVVNEKLVQELGFESNEAAIGQRIFIGFNEGRVDIVGVVANFKQGPLSNAIRPVLITSVPNQYEKAGIKIEANTDVPKAIAAIEQAWKKVYPEGVFSYRFLDEQINAYYKAEEQLFGLFKIFAGVAMLISCLGLFALAAFTTQHRVKEIGIRKVLGATVRSILVLVSKDFLKLVLISLALATPLAWYGISKWLTNYAFHIEISPWTFALAALIVIIVTIATIGTQAFKSAIANPTESLKSE